MLTPIENVPTACSKTPVPRSQVCSPKPAQYSQRAHRVQRWLLSLASVAMLVPFAHASGPSVTSIQQTMAYRAQQCAAALTIESTRLGSAKRPDPRHHDAARRYTSLALMMAPGSTPASLVQSLDRPGMSRSRLRAMARDCLGQLEQKRLQFSLDSVPGFPANDLLRARLCGVTLEAGTTLLDPVRDAAMIRGLRQIKGRLNLYYLERGRGLGIPVRADDASRQAFRSPVTGSNQPTGDEVADCFSAGKNLLVTIHDPWSASGR